MERDKTVQSEQDPVRPASIEAGSINRAPPAPEADSTGEGPGAERRQWWRSDRIPGGWHPELEASRDHFAELYDFAPIAYCTLDRQGLVADINLRGADLLGRDRSRIVGGSLLPFVDPADRRTFLDHIYRCRIEHGPVKSEVWLRIPPAEAVYAQLLSLPAGHRDPDQFRTAIIDQTDYFRAREAAAAHKAHLVELNEELEARARESERRAKQLQALTLQITHAEHVERRRIARFLHDHLQQLLVTATLQTGMLIGCEREQIEAKVGRMREVLDTAIERSRDLSRELCPPVLDDYGLIDALEWLAEEYRTDQVMDVRIHAKSAVTQSNRDLEIFLFEAARELLLNALKNGNAAQAIVTVKETADAITLSVSDDGTGDEPGDAADDVTDDAHGNGPVDGARVQATPGIGLTTIRERLDMLGGSLHVDTAPGEGFRVTLQCPIGTPWS